MQKNSAFKKLKFFLSIVRPQRRRRKGVNAELNSLSNCDKFRWRICVSTAQETEKLQNLIDADEFTFQKIKIFLIKDSSSE